MAGATGWSRGGPPAAGLSDSRHIGRDRREDGLRSFLACVESCPDVRSRRWASQVHEKCTHSGSPFLPPPAMGGVTWCLHNPVRGGFMRARPLSLLTAIGALAVLPRPGTGQQPVTVTGRVTSEAGTPLLLVDVRVPELALGALTRDDGVYTIVVPGARVSNQQVTIVARVLGYKSQSVRITLSGGIVTQDFRLASNPLQLGEVVVTGAGTAIETEKLGNVRNHVDSSAIQKAGEVNVVEALAAKAPNVTVVQESGDPGAGSFINIRGVNSILGPNQPLFVVDGMPMDNSTYSTSNFNRIDDAGGSTTQAGQPE